MDNQPSEEVVQLIKELESLDVDDLFRAAVELTKEIDTLRKERDELRDALAALHNDCVGLEADVEHQEKMITELRAENERLRANAAASGKGE